MFAVRRLYSLDLKMMKKTLYLALAAACLTSPALAAEKFAAKVNGVEIPQSRLDYLLSSIEGQGGGAPLDKAQLRSMARDQLIMTELLKQQAIAQKLDQTQEYRNEMENLSSGVLASLYVRQWVKKQPVSEAVLREHYQTLKAQMAQKEVHARHILLENEKDAQAILDDLRKGRAFAELAKERSLDPGSKTRGGDLGWASPTVFDPAFGEALVALERGQITTKPVKSQFGWHVIQLMDVRDVDFPTLEAIRPQLLQQVQNELLQKHLDQLRNKAKIEHNLPK